MFTVLATASVQNARHLSNVEVAEPLLNISDTSALYSSGYAVNASHRIESYVIAPVAARQIPAVLP